MYPADKYDPRAKVNAEGITYTPESETVIFAEDVTQLDQQVVAIQDTLGVQDPTYVTPTNNLLQWFLDKQSFNWQTSDFLQIAEGAVIPKGAVLTADIGNTTTDKLILNCPAEYPYIADWELNPTVDFLMAITGYEHFTMFIGMGDYVDGVGGFFVGFKMVDGDVHVICIDGDSGHQTETTLTGVHSSGAHQYRIERQGGNYVKFFVDGQLRHTETNDLFSDGNFPFLNWQIYNTVSGYDKTYNLGIYQYHRNYASL